MAQARGGEDEKVREVGEVGEGRTGQSRPKGVPHEDHVLEGPLAERVVICAERPGQCKEGVFSVD